MLKMLLKPATHGSLSRIPVMYAVRRITGSFWFNLCTEITLNTGEDETAVCNLGSVFIQPYARR